MTLKETDVRDCAEGYKATNGTVIRTILAQWKCSRFTWRDLINVLGAYKIDKADVMESMLVFDEAGYIIVKERSTGRQVSLWDYTDAISDVEFMLAKKGRDVAYDITADPAVTF